MTQPKNDGLQYPNFSKLIQVDPSLLKGFTSKAKIITSRNLDGQPSSSNIDDLFVIPKIQFELPYVNILTKHINDLWSSKIDSMLIQNAQVLLVGVTLGAAISTGVFIGLFSVGCFFSLPTSSTSMPMPMPKTLFERFSSSVWRGLFWYRDSAAPAPAATTTTATATNITACEPKDETKTEIEETNSSISRKEVDNNVATLKSDRVIIIQGNPEISTSIGETGKEAIIASSDGNHLEGNQRKIVNDDVPAQYRSCLDSITASLKKHSLQWNNVANVSTKLVSTAIGSSSVDNDDKNAQIFRSMLNEYIVTSSQKRNTLVSISFVSRLEDRNSKVQVEVLAS